jgi:hypothetical protein
MPGRWHGRRRVRWVVRRAFLPLLLDGNPKLALRAGLAEWFPPLPNKMDEAQWASSIRGEGGRGSAISEL